MKKFIKILGIVCVLMVISVNSESPVFCQVDKDINVIKSEVTLTDENGNKITLPVDVSEPVREINCNQIFTKSSDNVESYSQEFSVTIDEDAVKDAVARSDGSLSDTTYDNSLTLKLWGRIYYDKKMQFVDKVAVDTYLVTRMEGHFKNTQPERLDLINPHVYVACTNNFNDASGQHLEWWTGTTFNNYTGFQYYAFANQPFAAIGGTMICQGRTADGHTWDVYLPLLIAGELPGL